MKRSIFIIVSVSLVFAMTGCATIFKGSNESVSMSSDPDGAEVYSNGQFLGKTPLRINLRSKDVYSIEFRKAGYETKVVQVNNRVGLGWIVLDIVTGFVPVVIDAFTGDWFQLETTTVRAALQSK